MSIRWSIAKNALANSARGGAAGVVALFLPAILTRHMSQLDYSIWALVLQIAAYSVYLNFGLQTANGRFVPFADGNGKVLIGENVWLGDGVVVLLGSSIGRGSVIAANSVVNGPIAPLTIATGVPAKIVKVFHVETHEWVRA